MLGASVDKRHPSQWLLGGRAKTLSQAGTLIVVLLQSGGKRRHIGHQTEGGLIQGATALAPQPACGKIQGQYTAATYVTKPKAYPRPACGKIQGKYPTLGI